jgi:hypothetical protein
MPNLADLIAGRGTRRTRPEQTSVFLNDNGLGAQFAMCGAALYKRAVAKRRRGPLTDWFTRTCIVVGRPLRRAHANNPSWPGVMRIAEHDDRHPAGDAGSRNDRRLKMARLAGP